MSKPLSEDDRVQIAAAIRGGRKIEAIKLYRMATGEGLKEAKDAIDAMDAEMPADIPHEQIAEALFAGHKIEAVRLYRKAAGTDLRESKLAVDALEAELRRDAPDRFEKTAKRGCGTNLILLIMAASLAVAASWTFLRN